MDDVMKLKRTCHLIAYTTTYYLQKREQSSTNTTTKLRKENNIFTYLPISKRLRGWIHWLEPDFDNLMSLTFPETAPKLDHVQILGQGYAMEHGQKAKDKKSLNNKDPRIQSWLLEILLRTVLGA